MLGFELSLQSKLARLYKSNETRSRYEYKVTQSCLLRRELAPKSTRLLRTNVERQVSLIFVTVPNLKHPRICHHVKNPQQ